VTKQGLSRAHQREEDRKRYSIDSGHRERRKAHSTRKRRGVERVPTIAREYLLELFENGCAYCPGAAETWITSVSVIKGDKDHARQHRPVLHRLQ